MAKQSWGSLLLAGCTLVAARGSASGVTTAVGPHGAASAVFDAAAYNATGWATLDVTTNTTLDETLQAYDAGFVEGTLTQHMTFLFSLNVHGGKSTFSPALSAYVSANFDYMRAQVAANAGVDLYWHHVNLTLTQWAGFVDGYNSVAPADEALDAEALYSLTLIGDLDDLCPAYGCNNANKRGEHTCKSKAECDAVPDAPVHFDRPGNGHCSILVKGVGESSFAPQVCVAFSVVAG